MPRARNTGRRLIKPRGGMTWDKDKKCYVRRNKRRETKNTRGVEKNK